LEPLHQQVGEKCHDEHTGDDHGIDLPGVPQDHRGLAYILNLQKEKRGSQEEEMPV
jgi:hypothetical protein